MNDLAEVRADIAAFVVSNSLQKSLIHCLDELELARKVINAHNKYDKTLHRYQALLSGVSEEITDISEIEQLLVGATSALETARQNYSLVANDEH